MKKLIAATLLACACTMGVQAQLLYRISGNGLEKSSYIIGTHHLGNTGFIDKIAGVTDALTNTDQVYGEVKWDDIANPDSMAMMKKASTLPDGKTLKDVLTSEQYAKLNAYLKSTMQVDLTNPMVAAQMGNMTPFAMLSQLTIIGYMMNHMGEFDPTSTFDQYFQAQAKKNNEPTGGLETVKFQMNTLFEKMPMERQVEQLMCFLDDPDYSNNMNEQVAKAFYAQDIDTILKLMTQKRGDSCDATPEEDNYLIYDRNADWLTKMPAIMTQKPTFFVVGAGHLPGDRGVLQGLRTQGYTVEAVK